MINKVFEKEGVNLHRCYLFNIRYKGERWNLSVVRRRWLATQAFTIASIILEHHLTSGTLLTSRHRIVWITAARHRFDCRRRHQLLWQRGRHQQWSLNSLRCGFQLLPLVERCHCGDSWAGVVASPYAPAYLSSTSNFWILKGLGKVRCPIGRRNRK